jgi:hypothetical protein
VIRAQALDAEVVLPPHRNPPEGPGGPDHRELWLRDPDGYLIVLASPDGESPWPDPRVEAVARAPAPPSPHSSGEGSD